MVIFKKSSDKLDNNIDKKSLITGIVILLILCITGAYAYYRVSRSTTTSIYISGDIPEIGNVILSGSELEGTISLSRDDVGRSNSGTDYYYPSSGQAATIATISASGNQSDNITYYCKVDVTVTNTLTSGSINDGDVSITYGGSLLNELKKNGVNVLSNGNIYSTNSVLNGNISKTTTDEFVIKSGETLTLTELLTIHNRSSVQMNFMDLSFTTKTEVDNLICDTQGNISAYTPLELLNTKKGTGGLSDHVSGGLYRYQGNTQRCSYNGGDYIVVNTSGTCSNVYSYSVSGVAYHYQSSCPDTVDDGVCTKYVGTLVPDVDNYLCIGDTTCSTDKNTPDSHTYRILGITPDGNLKVISMFNDGNKQWAPTADLNYDWSNSPLQIYLNQETSGGYLSKLGVYKELIETWDWYYTKTFDMDGDTKTLRSSVNYVGNTDNATTQYANDTNTTRLATLSAKVGLMNLSDFYYASCDTCGFSTTVWLNSTNNDGSGYAELTSSRGSFNGAWLVNVTRVGYGYNLVGMTAIRPVFYLSSNIYLSGAGTKSNPYVLVS